MSDIRKTHVEMKSDRKGKIIAATIVGLAVLAGATHLYREGLVESPTRASRGA